MNDIRVYFDPSDRLMAGMGWNVIVDDGAVAWRFTKRVFAEDTIATWALEGATVTYDQPEIVDCPRCLGHGEESNNAGETVKCDLCEGEMVVELAVAKDHARRLDEASHEHDPDIVPDDEVPW